MTLDLDVLSDIPDTPEPPKKGRKIRLAAPKQEKTSSRKKNENARGAATQKTEKKQPAQKTVQPRKETKPNRYQVKETGRQDEHDKLKPRANPVPVVKVLKSTPMEPPKTETAAEPEISKHFLEQQAQQKPAEAVAVIETSADGTEQPALAVQEAVKPSPAVKTIVRRSVFPVNEKLGRKGRSLALFKEIPTDSATAKAVERGQSLYDIFLFEDRSAELTDEMRLELIAIAEEMKKAPKRRLLLLSYSGSTAPERGRERQLSLRRALTVRSMLTRLGIRSLRIELRSQGQKGAGDNLPNRVDILFDD